MGEGRERGSPLTQCIKIAEETRSHIADMGKELNSSSYKKKIGGEERSCSIWAQKRDPEGEKEVLTLDRPDGETMKLLWKRGRFFPPARPEHGGMRLPCGCRKGGMNPMMRRKTDDFSYRKGPKGGKKNLLGRGNGESST